MIRRPTYTDYPAIEGIVRRTHEMSKYAGRARINDKALSQLLLGLHAGQGQSGPNSSFVAVSEEKGEVRGFVAGTLLRVYNVMDKLAAAEVFLINEGKTGGSLGLVDAYVEWARSNPRVVEIGLTWTDAVPGSERLAALYRRKGFSRTGETFEMRLDVPAEAVTA